MYFDGLPIHCYLARWPGCRWYRTHWLWQSNKPAYCALLTYRSCYHLSHCYSQFIYLSSLTCHCWTRSLMYRGQHYSLLGQSTTSVITFNIHIQYSKLSNSSSLSSHCTHNTFFLETLHHMTLKYLVTGSSAILAVMQSEIKQTWLLAVVPM